jgi:hypothetical protein
MALYGNNSIYYQDILLFRTNDKRANWYLSRDLAEIVQEDPDGGKKIRLKFQPKGLGNSEDPFYIEKKKNVCVVCGDNIVENLTKHHVVPSVYRKNFPLEYKDRSSHDVVLMCKKHHYEYEEYALEFKNILAEEFGVPTLSKSSMVFYDTNIKRAKGIAFALTNYRKQMPKDRIEALCNEFEYITSLKAIKKNFNRISKSSLGYSTKEIEHGKAMVDKITNYQNFVERWRQHFLDYAKPQYLSEHWSVTKIVSTLERKRSKQIEEINNK